jgi:hypothetical protein
MRDLTLAAFRKAISSPDETRSVDQCLSFGWRSRCGRTCGRGSRFNDERVIAVTQHDRLISLTTEIAFLYRLGLNFCVIGRRHL